MSGIVAVQGTFQSSDRLESMLGKLEHRGPDTRETYSCTNVSLGEVRNESESEFVGDYESDGVLVLDGNPSYKGEKIDRTELFQLYKKIGPEIFTELGNDFAFILTDGKELVAARDIFGARPLYYVEQRGDLVFASELKALEGMESEVKIFSPGTFYTSSNGFTTFRQVPDFDSEFEASVESERFNQKSRELNQLLINAVKANVDDWEQTGVLLSGGVDSSIIAAAFNRIALEPIKTFAVGIEGSEDVLKARQVAKYLNSYHQEYTYDYEDMLKVLSQVIYYLESFDVELVNSSIANFLVAREAKNAGIDTVLSGEGADELFGGYHHLKECTTDKELNRELEQLLQGLHNGGLQRVDRMTKAHALDCRMPFFDNEVINFARVLPCNWKISSQGMEKLILRQAFDGMLPDDVLWRKKVQFGIGSGNEGAMEEMIKDRVTDKEYRNAQKKTSFTFKSKIEYYYYKIFKQHYPLDDVESMVNRWLA